MVVGAVAVAGTRPEHLQVNTSRLESKNFKAVPNVSLEVDLIYLSCDLCAKPQLKSCTLENNPGVAQKSLKCTSTRTKVLLNKYEIMASLTVNHIQI